MILHKYVDEKGLDLLENLRLKVNDPGNYNDPFELLCKVDGEITVSMVKQRLQDNEKIQSLYRTAKANGYVGSEDEFKNKLIKDGDKVAEGLTKDFRGMINKFISATHETAKEFFRVVCFSRQMPTEGKEILML